MDDPTVMGTSRVACRFGCFALEQSSVLKCSPERVVELARQTNMCRA
jgi:hypothetical protein